MELKKLGTSQITASCWAIFNGDSQELIEGKFEHIQREIASLTKIMTTYTVLKISEQFNMDIKNCDLTVSYNAAITSGSTANLLVGDTMTVYDMLHAMLLPSGNDAAVALAEHFGSLIISLSDPPLSKYADPIKLFMDQMNENAKALGLSNTFFCNPHGMSDTLNKSTAFDIGKLSIHCMQNPMFSSIVKKMKYLCTGKDLIGNPKKYVWLQTNRLLNKGFNGIKTGTTNTAGLCLAASCNTQTAKLIIIVLACKGQYHRWQDVVELKDWALNKLDSQEIKYNCVTLNKSFAAAKDRKIKYRKYSDINGKAHN